MCRCGDVQMCLCSCAGRRRRRRWWWWWWWWSAFLVLTSFWSVCQHVMAHRYRGVHACRKNPSHNQLVASPLSRRMKWMLTMRMQIVGKGMDNWAWAFGVPESYDVLCHCGLHMVALWSKSWSRWPATLNQEVRCWDSKPRIKNKPPPPPALWSKFTDITGAPQCNLSFSLRLLRLPECDFICFPCQWFRFYKFVHHFFDVVFFMPGKVPTITSPPTGRLETWDLLGLPLLPCQFPRNWVWFENYWPQWNYYVNFWWMQLATLVLLLPGYPHWAKLHPTWGPGSRGGPGWDPQMLEMPWLVFDCDSPGAVRRMSLESQGRPLSRGERRKSMTVHGIFLAHIRPITSYSQVAVCAISHWDIVNDPDDFFPGQPRQVPESLWPPDFAWQLAAFYDGIQDVLDPDDFMAAPSEVTTGAPRPALATYARETWWSNAIQNQLGTTVGWCWLCRGVATAAREQRWFHAHCWGASREWTYLLRSSSHEIHGSEQKTTYILQNFAKYLESHTWIFRCQVRLQEGSLLISSGLGWELVQVITSPGRKPAVGTQFAAQTLGLSHLGGQSWPHLSRQNQKWKTVTDSVDHQEQSCTQNSPTGLDRALRLMNLRPKSKSAAMPKAAGYAGSSRAMLDETATIFRSRVVYDKLIASNVLCRLWCLAQLYLLAWNQVCTRRASVRPVRPVPRSPWCPQRSRAAAPQPLIWWRNLSRRGLEDILLVWR